MARKKVKLQYIQNHGARKVSYNKRVKGLIKKTQELSILCGVAVCAIVYGPFDNVPVVWPSCEAEARRILMNYKAKSDMEKNQRKVNQQAYLEQNLSKARDKMLKLAMRNRQLEVENIVSELLKSTPVDRVAVNDLPDLYWIINEKLRMIGHRIRMVCGASNPPLAYPISNAHVNLPNLIKNLRDEMMVRFNMDGTSPSEMQAGPSQHYE